MTTNDQILGYLKQNVGGVNVRIEYFYGDGVQDPMKWIEDFE
jgi:hypothetical protein